MSPDGSVVTACGPGSPVTTGVRLSAAAGVDATVATTIGARMPAPTTSTPVSALLATARIRRPCRPSLFPKIRTWTPPRRSPQFAGEEPSATAAVGHRLNERLPQVEWPNWQDPLQVRGRGRARALRGRR